MVKELFALDAGHDDGNSPEVGRCRLGGGQADIWGLTEVEDKADRLE